MEVSEYIKGKGIDTSKKRRLFGKVMHIYKDYDGLYFLYPDVDFESLDFIYNEDSLEDTKFLPLLMNEWVKYLKKGGFLIISVKEDRVKKRIKEAYRRTISRHTTLEEQINRGGRTFFIFRKKINYLRKVDSINKWTFGIITNGKRKEWIKKFIESVRLQGIENYEIIIVGKWDDKEAEKRKDIRFIEFFEKDYKGWITKKKNIVFENARYENVLVLHDRFFLDKDWFKGMKKYGNYWDCIFFPIIDASGNEYIHWGPWGYGFFPIGYAEINDWDYDYFVGGCFMAIKKSVWEKERLNEERFWGEQEDSEYGLRIQKSGFIVRPNPYSKLHTFTIFRPTVKYEFNKFHLGKPYDTRGYFRMLLQCYIDASTRYFGINFIRIKYTIIKKIFTNKRLSKVMNFIHLS